MRISGDHKLRLRPEFAVIPLEEGTVLVRSPHQGVRVSVDGLASARLAALIRAMDGRTSVATLLGDGGTNGGVESLLEGLVARDILDAEAGAPPSSSDGRFFAQFHEDPEGCSRRFAASRVVVVGTSSLAEYVARDLRTAGVKEIVRVPATCADEATDVAVSVVDRRTLARACRGAHLALVCPASAGRSGWESTMNEVALEIGLAWLSVRLCGGEGFVGPLFVDGEGPCHMCVLAREEANWVDPELTRTYLDCVAKDPATLDAYGRLPAFAAIMSQWAVLEATKYLSRFTVPALLNNVLRVEFVACRMQLHRVLRLPRCPQCSSAVRLPGVNTLLYARPE